MMSLEDKIRTLNPQQREELKSRLAGALNQMPEATRASMLDRLRGLQTSTAPSMARPATAPPSATATPQAPADLQWWQKGLQAVAAPFEAVEKGFATAVTAPFTKPVAGTENLPFWERERAEYEAWQSPWGVKGAIQSVPWFATAIASGGIGVVGGLGARLGISGLTKAAAIGTKVLKPALQVERIINYPISKPLELAAKKVLPGVVSKAARIVTDLQPMNDAISAATQPSKLRSLVNMSIGGKQPFKGMAEAIAGKAATADNPAAVGLVGRAILRFEGANKAIATTSTLNRLGNSKKLFNLTDEGLMKIGEKEVHLNTIRTYPEKYAKNLTSKQNDWIRQAQILEQEKLALLERNGIEINKLNFEDGGVYAGRRVVGKFTPEGELIEGGYIGAGQPAKPGVKMAQEKTRVFNDIKEATDAGFRYLPEEEALYYNTAGAYNRVADKQFANWFLERVPYRTTAVGGDIAVANTTMKGTQTALKQMNSIALKLKNNESVSGQMLRGIKKYYPEEYEQIKLFTKGKYTQSDVDGVLRFVWNEQKTNAADWANIKNEFTKARKSLVRPGFTGTMAPDIPAFAGKVFTSPEAKDYINIIRKELNPQFNSALNAVNQVNAVGRYFALAGDVSVGGIQLLFLAGAHPKIYGKAMTGFVRSFFDPLYHDNFIAKHLATIQNHPGLIISKGGATEMTEAMAREGLLNKGPLKIIGTPLVPFQRGFETALDTAGVYMAEAYQHLGTSPARMAQVDAFINEFRGLLSTKRLSLSSTQRQLERATILAPQYNRAVGALLTDMTQGNLRGQLARQAMIKGTGAIMAMTVAVSLAMGESEDEIADHLNPMSSNFMTWDVAGQRVGPGSKVRSLMYLFGKITKNPEDAAYHASRFVRGNFSPFLGTSIDLITGKDYMGDPTRDGLLNLTETVVGENLLPIWVQSVTTEGGELKERVLRGLTEFGGGRAYPAGSYVELRELQDKKAQEQYGVSWEALGQRADGMVAQMQIARDPELQQLTMKASEESAKFAHGEQLVWNSYTDRADQVGNVVLKEIQQASVQFEATGDGSKLRERVNQAYWLKSQMMNELLQQDEFKLVKDAFGKPLTPAQRQEMQPQKLLYRDYNELMYSPDMFDQYGEYRFDEADRRRQQFIQHYGSEALASVEAVIGEKRADEPIAVKALRQAREVLKPYWAIEDAVYAKYATGLKQIAVQIDNIERTDRIAAKRLLLKYPDIMRARKLIAVAKKRMKLQHPDMATALRIFYS
uniref:Large polyvalent protein associated domain-containing protein n=1 Tax=viral metagenome TaxID=1070528 RepID=A0A6M3XES0_9ZZZZ